MNLEDELRDLGRADDFIVTAQHRVDHQMQLLQELERDGHDTALATKLLSEMRQTLQLMVEYRALVAECVGRMRSEKR